MQEIQLTNGEGVVQVDDEDALLVQKYKWRFDSKKNYAIATIAGRSVRMHKLLMPGVPLVDHKDRNRLNNQRSSNLRPATKAQNGHNAGPYHGRERKTSKYKGVSRQWQRDGWTAYITANGTGHYLGYFHTEEEAAHAYDAAALRLHGEFAYQNFPCIKRVA